MGICSFFFFLERNRRYSHWLHLFLEQGEGERKEYIERCRIWIDLIQSWRKHPSPCVRVKGHILVNLLSEMHGLVLFFNSRKSKNAGMGSSPESKMETYECLTHLPPYTATLCSSSIPQDLLYKSPRDLVHIQIPTQMWSKTQDFAFVAVPVEFPSSPIVGLCALTAEGLGSVPGQGAKIPQARLCGQKETRFPGCRCCQPRTTF